MKRLNLAVVGTLASDPFAGMAWMHMQILLGLLKLGHNAYYFETTSAWPYDPTQQIRVNNINYSLPYLEKLFSDFGIPDRWVLRSRLTENQWYGMSQSKAETFLKNADAIFNIAGATRLYDIGPINGRLIYYGTDPVYPEIKYSQNDPYYREIIDEHTDSVTYGENIGNSICPVPPLPHLKAKTRQPVILDLWTNKIIPDKKFTSVGNWKQSGHDIKFQGETYYWSKHLEFLKFIDLPKRIKVPLEFATNLSKPTTTNTDQIPSHSLETDDYTMLTSNGWQLKDGPSFSTDPWKYRDYIVGSQGEFTFAKDQNIRLKSGWFSERSACYLAAGRPVIAQDTGFGTVLPVGSGLFSFNSFEDIITAFDTINSDYEKHSKAAREIAEEYFRAEKVMEKVLLDLNLT